MLRRWQRSGELPKSCASSANLLAFSCGPPWAWIDWSAVLTELFHSRIGSENGSLLGCRSHNRDRLSRLNKLPDIDGNALHSGDQDMIPATGVEDQELSVTTEGAGIHNPAITRRCDLGTGPGRQGGTFIDTARPIGTTEFANLGTIHGIGEHTLCGGKSNRRALARGVFQRVGVRLVVERNSLQAGGGGGLGRSLDVLLHGGNEPLQGVNLLGERNCAAAFGR